MSTQPPLRHPFGARTVMSISPRRRRRSAAVLRMHHLQSQRAAARLADSAPRAARQEFTCWLPEK